MNLSKTIGELLEHKEKLERMIASLEEPISFKGDRPEIVPNRRGRKFMGAQERRQVSARIKGYWARRRKAK
jgi:hypothetical protein